MNKKFNELINKQVLTYEEFLTYEELSELEEMEEVIEVEDCGLSGKYINKHYWNVITKDSEYDVYTK